MYVEIEIEDNIKITPDNLNENYDTIIEKLTRETFEGIIQDENLIILVTDVKKIGPGRMIPGSGNVFQKIKFTAISQIFKLNEIVEGYICDVTKFGAFIRIGCIDALCHISQLMDEKVYYDSGHSMFVTKSGKKNLSIGDIVRARIVSLNLNKKNPIESRIGLTMRQPGIGKLEWLIEEEKEKLKKGKKK